VIEFAPKYGYLPITFPRDPVEVNQFPEHIVLGQILSPLIETDADGNLLPGIARRWEFSKDRKTIIFELDSSYKFDNGNQVTSGDVKYSIDRHLSGRSQSRNFLSSIQEIQAPSPNEIHIILKEPDTAIIKALSRDHLGILPKGWVFDKSSDRPYISSGPYSLIKEGERWHLKKNLHYGKAREVNIPNWDLIYFASSGLELPIDEIPDVVLFASFEMVQEFKKLVDRNLEDFKIDPIPSFLQTSAWFYPHGKDYGSEAARFEVMALIDRLVSESLESTEFERATGVVPMGVAGHLLRPMRFLDVKVAKNRKVKIAQLGNLYDFIFESDFSKNFLEKQNIDLEIIRVGGPTIADLPTKRPDVIFAAWAGGFNDPDGFLPILSSILQTDAKQYLSLVSKSYLEARSEGDWTKRSSLFEELNSKLVENRHMVPGWKIPTYSITRNKYVNAQKGFRYTPRLSKVVRQVQVNFQ